MKRVLLIAFHFPPLAGSSGVQRTLRFAQYLPALGWQPIVLTATPRAYERTTADLHEQVPKEVVVRRALAFDAARQLSIRGRYPGFLARPDRWMTWQFDAVRQGDRIIREFRADVLWSTYPIATAHVIAAKLQARHGLPWIADFRDPMAQDGYPPDPKTWAVFHHIEQETVRRANLSVFTTPGAAREYQQRYPKHAARIRVIENGYDEDSFAMVEAEAARLGPLAPGVITLLHSGIVYPSERDPTQLIEALARLKQAGVRGARSLRIRFRAAVHDDLLLGLARRLGVQEAVEVMPPVGYREALVEMLRADGLLLLQASNCNSQIPAKLYEYLRARRPLLALTDPQGDTAATLKAAGIREVAPLDDAAEIARLLERFTSDPGARDRWLSSEPAVRAASRMGRTEALVKLLQETS